MCAVHVNKKAQSLLFLADPYLMVMGFLMVHRSRPCGLRGRLQKQRADSL